MDYREPTGAIDYRNPYLKLPFLKFPLWHVCPRCGRMSKSDYHLSSPPYCEGPIGSGADSGKPHRKRKCFQVRFLTPYVVRGILLTFRGKDGCLMVRNGQPIKSILIGLKDIETNITASGFDTELRELQWNRDQC